MPRISFQPSNLSVDVDPQTKILLAARKATVSIRFGCAACRCGMCGIRVLSGQENMSPIKPNELDLLKRLRLATDGSVRLACQARVEGECSVDLDFQDTYNPDVGSEEEKP